MMRRMAMLIFLPLFVAQTTAPASNNPLVMKLAAMPQNLWPTDGEVTARKQARDKWLTQVTRPIGPYTATFKLRNIAVENVRSSDAGTIKDEKAAVAHVESTIELWGKERQMQGDIILSNKDTAQITTLKAGEMITVNMSIYGFSLPDADRLIFRARGTLLKSGVASRP